MSAADLLADWRDHLAANRRRSPHTVRAYLAAARRFIEATGRETRPAIAGIEAPSLRAQLARRRAAAR